MPSESFFEMIGKIGHMARLMLLEECISFRTPLGNVFYLVKVYVSFSVSGRDLGKG